MSLVEVPEDLADFNAWAIARRWSDGLPLVPPTRERVDEMLLGTAWPADATVGSIPPRNADATVEKIAANAVMAGCTPSAMPILIAAVHAMIEPPVNLYGAQATTHPCALMVMVTGPIATFAGVHGGVGLFGPGFPANATIGRAVRLIQQNIGGAWPGETDRATQGSPAKFSFCFAENEEDSPWQPYRVEQGYDVTDSTVTVVAAEAPHNLNDHVSSDARGVLFTFAQTMATIGTNNAYCRPADFVLVISPEHARVVYDAGFTPADVRQYLYERARIPYKQWKLGGMFGMLNQPRHLDAADDDYPVPILATPDDVHVLVGGGAGRHSAWIPTFGISRTSTVRVTGPDGAPVHA
jgi:hypothetical protein